MRFCSSGEKRYITLEKRNIVRENSPRGKLLVIDGSEGKRLTMRCMRNKDAGDGPNELKVEEKKKSAAAEIEKACQGSNSAVGVV